MSGTHGGDGASSRTALIDAADRLAFSGVDRPGFEAQLLLAIVLGVRRIDVMTHPDLSLDAERLARFHELVERRIAHEPMAYLRGSQEFYALEYEVTPATLIPRPETELLVEVCLKAIRNRPARVADIGTGSGCVAVTVAAHADGAWVLATDLSRSALRVAQRNARRHGVADRVLFAECDLASALAPRSFDAILSNPPYIPSADINTLQPEVSKHEPRLALDGGSDGLEVYRKLVGQAAGALSAGGLLAVEVGLGQAVCVSELMSSAGLVAGPILRDLAGIERVVTARTAT